MKHCREVKSSRETNLAHLTIFMEVTDSKARMQSSTWKFEAGMTAMTFRTSLDCSVWIRPMRGYIEKLCLNDKKESSQGRREVGVKCTWRASLYLHLHTVPLLLENFLQTPRNDQAQTRRSRCISHNFHCVIMSVIGFWFKPLDSNSSNARPSTSQALGYIFCCPADTGCRIQ